MRHPLPRAILIVEDHPLTRAGTRSLFESAFPGCVIHEASSLREARSRLRERAWNLVVLDLRLPDGKGIDLLTDCSAPVLVLTMDDQSGSRDEAMRAGAAAFALKTESPERIHSLVVSLLGREGAVGTGRSRIPALSIRERQVLRHLLEGKSLVELAQEFRVAPTTIQSYKNRLFHKLAVDTLPQLVRLAGNWKI